jgi:hypothetical protein
VVVAGCLSMDGPAENGVRYLLRGVGGRDGLLEIGWADGALCLSMSPAMSGPIRARSFVVTCDQKGRACVPLLGARVDPESRDPRELEHFLRRMVRALSRS